jgi:hypothetical protein
LGRKRPKAGADAGLEDAVTEAALEPGDGELSSGLVATADDADANTMADAELPAGAGGPRVALQLDPGDEVGRFLVEETIGQGGMESSSPPTTPTSTAG